MLYIKYVYTNICNLCSIITLDNEFNNITCLISFFFNINMKKINNNMGKINNVNYEHKRNNIEDCEWGWFVVLDED